jgi:glutamate-ammonia-ligase adenylyltransferase
MVEKEIVRTLRTDSDPAKIAADARDMRAKLAAQFPSTNRWDLKFASGGLVDIEFIAQTLQLCAAPRGPDVLDGNTLSALHKLGAAKVLTANDTNALIYAASLQQALTQVLRIALDGTLEPDSATPGLKALLVRATGESGFARLEARLAQAQSAVREIFERVVV